MFSVLLKQFSFSKFYSYVTFDFDLISGSSFTFWGPNGLYLALGYSSIAVLRSTHVVEQPSFSLFLAILIFVVDLILGSFLTFWGPNGLFLGSGFPNGQFLGWGRVQQLFWGPLI